MIDTLCAWDEECGVAVDSGACVSVDGGGAASAG